MYSPLTGTVVASNEAVEGKPGLVNSSPEEDGWLFRVLLEDEQEVVLPTTIKSIQKRVFVILVKFAIFRWQGLWLPSNTKSSFLHRLRTYLES